MADLKSGDYKIDNLYQGGFSSLKPDYGDLFTGYRASASTIGITTTPQVSNILKEFSDKVATGQKHIELTMISPGDVDRIPKQHLKEVKRLAKLTGMTVSIHGPLVEPSGFPGQNDGTPWGEPSRELAERRMLNTMEKAYETSPKGGTPVTFHSSAILPSPTYKKEEGKEEYIEQMAAVNQETGELVPIKREEKYYPRKTPEEGTGRIIPAGTLNVTSAERQVKVLNDSQWSDSLTQLITPIERNDQIFRETEIHMQHIAPKLVSGTEVKDLTDAEKEIYSRYKDAAENNEDLQKHLDSLFNKAYKYGSEGDRNKLMKFTKTFEEDLKNSHSERGQLDAMRKLRQNLNKVHPEQFKAVNDFALEKSSQTFGNVAYKTYKKYGKDAPIVSIENHPAWMGALSRGKDLKNLVEKSHEQFVKNAVKDGMGEGAAKKEAQKMIGVTWDVGHINQLRRFGFSKEDIVKETGEIKKYLKHIHLSDNFGTENIELPMGMGDVPLKEMMEKLGRKADDVKKIIEAGDWWTHFRTSPIGVSMEALGTSFYSGDAGGPQFNQVAGFEQGYFSGYGQTFPQINYETFGAGFSQLPADLGGQRGGGNRGGRLSGTPME